MPLADVGLQRQVEFLVARKADAMAHSGTTLLAHLVGTFEILRAWSCSPEIAAAGLFHSIYGTEAFECSLARLTEREDVRDVVGLKGERLAYLFCSMSRESFLRTLLAPDPQSSKLQLRMGLGSESVMDEDLQALCHIAAANALEQHDRLSRRGNYAGNFPECVARYVTPQAAFALAQSFGQLSRPDHQASDA